MNVHTQGQVDSNAGMSDAEMDAAISGESTSRNIPMEAEAPAAIEKYTLNINGKDVTADIEQLKKWAQMGYNYPQRANELNQKSQMFETQRQEFEKQRKEFESKYNPYREVDEYAAKNPDWWTEVQNQYKQKLAGAQSNPEVMQLKEEIAELRKFRDDLMNEKQSLKAQEEDSKLSQEVKSIREQNPDIDFDSPDAEGLNLEMRVLKHAQENGLPTFKAAFADYYLPHLLSKAKDKGKELASKEVQKRTKLGILGESSKPTKGLRVAENVRGKSYNDLQREAMEELGIA